jgi:CBS domain-containing protein
MNPTEHLATIATQLKGGGTTEPVTVRTFLGWFGIQRRGYYKVRTLRSALKKSGLVTVPDFEGEYIDGLVRFELATDAAEGVAEAPAEPSPAAPVVAGGVADDPTYRIGKLPAANTSLVSVKPESPLQEATSLMMSKHYSQLPVMQSEFGVKGVISWRSIGTRTALSAGGALAKDFMEEPVIVSSDASLFSVIDTIVEREYALVKAPNTGRITGIVTTTDLSLQFRQLGEPFLLLGEIENHVRSLIDGVFTLAELREAVDPGDTSREIESVADLTFGEYLRLLEKPANWDKLSLTIDRVVFVAELDRIREIRNDVMHFDPDPLAEADLSALRSFSRFLQTVMSVRVRGA